MVLLPESRPALDVGSAEKCSPPRKRMVVLSLWELRDGSPQFPMIPGLFSCWSGLAHPLRSCGANTAGCRFNTAATISTSGT